MLFKTKQIIILMVCTSVIFPPFQKARASGYLSQPDGKIKTVEVDNKNQNNLYGGTLIWGTVNPPTIINPILTSHSVSASLIPLIFNGLVRINSKGKIEPSLAHSWTISQNKKIYTFYLKKGIKFHDGIECTAEDVKFTYENIIDEEIQSVYRSHYDIVDKFEVVNKYTFRVILKEPFSPLLYKMNRYIVPQHLLKNTEIAKSPFNYHPIGTGPFKFFSWDKKDNKITLTANEDYFENKPYIDKVIVKTFPDNASLWSALMRHQVDMVLFINREDFEIVKRDVSFQAKKIFLDVYGTILYNPNDSILQNRRVREAIAHSVDKKRLIELTSIDGIESTGPYHPESKGFNKQVQPFRYNPTRAKEILEDQGWRDTDGDGVVEKKGEELVINLLVDAQNHFYRKIAMIIRQQLAAVGIKLKVKLYDDEDELTEHYLAKHNIQAWLRFFIGHGFDPYDGYDVAGNWYSLSSEFGKLWNYKKVDTLFEEARVTTDEQRRIEIYQEIHKRIYEDQPACFLFFPMSFHAVSAKFQNVDEVFTSYMPGYLIKDWYIKK